MSLNRFLKSDLLENTSQYLSEKDATLLHKMKQEVEEKVISKDKPVAKPQSKVSCRINEKTQTIYVSEIGSNMIYFARRDHSGCYGPWISMHEPVLFREPIEIIIPNQPKRIWF
jgi:hypothetical protein